MEFVFGYMLMLVVMTYSTWLFISVVVGSCLGYQICKVLDIRKRVLLLRYTGGQGLDNKLDVGTVAEPICHRHPVDSCGADVVHPGDDIDEDKAEIQHLTSV